MFNLKKKKQDAYTTEDIIYKWKYKDVKAGATKMTQFHYKRASLSTSVDIYKIGKSYFFIFLHYCRTNGTKLTMSQVGVRTSVKEYVGFCHSVVPSSFSKPKSPARVCYSSSFDDLNSLPML